MNYSSNKKGSSLNLSPSQDQHVYSSDEFSSPQGLQNIENNAQYKQNDSFDSPIPIKKPTNQKKTVSYNQIESLNDRESLPQQKQQNSSIRNKSAQNTQAEKQELYNMSFRNTNSQAQQVKKTYTLEEVQQLLAQEAEKYDEQQNRLVGQLYSLNEQNKALARELQNSKNMQENLLNQLEQIREVRNNSNLTHNRSASQDEFLKREQEFREAVKHQDDSIRLDKWIDALKKVEKMRKDLKEKIRKMCNTNNQSVLRLNARDLTYESKGSYSPQKYQIVYPVQIKQQQKYTKSTAFGKNYDGYLKSKHQKIDQKGQINNSLLLQKGQPTQTYLRSVI
ncbi:hypothetical protein TTHERM_00624690 (macronuclear) [Tetrahymena thermophila SB210]|uniref:Uncharacterized protein n=1 Tax=Tetrahymena thermophila (strain SB210) TaxID=312017 RepID=Q240R4_TETTS|nr:hypothetical protein TTHERM_00624690 [Tetrahymena thermophila SB210]EAS02350.3 hypothetical protein TTHERM_00624690 [Tetrahymena thermophila SB210]|eukprot:XP_001022595.3 hypothetical protein TTHERM_00624690 [Tetrahymena thermophila SB210]